MGTLIWVALGVGTFVVVTTLAVAAGLGKVARDASKLLEEEAWITAPPTRSTKAAARGDTQRTRAASLPVD